METLRAELARAKEQARRSDAAALKAVEELRAEKAAHRQSEDKIARAKIKSQAKTTDLEKTMVAAKENRSKIRAAKEELRQAGDIMAGKPFCCGRSSEIRSMPLWINYGVLQTHTWTWNECC